MPSSQTRGELFLLITVFMEGLYPILVQKTVGVFPPVFFGAISSYVAAFFLFWYLVYTKALTKGITWEVLRYILAVVLCIVVLGHVFVFIGSQYTTGINVGLLLRFELVTTFIVGTLLAKERLTTRQLGGAILIIIGVVSILFNGTLQFNRGDMLVIVATALFPVGNMFAKKALASISPVSLLFWRYSVGGSILLVLTPFVEPQAFAVQWTLSSVVFLLFFGTAMLIASKTCFYAGLQRLQMTNVIFLVTALATALTLLFSYLFLHEVPSLYQWVGFSISVLGAYFMNVRTRVPRSVPDHV